MKKQTASDHITQHFPDLMITSMQKLGEGLGNIAFEVNKNLIFRFPKNVNSQYQLEKEISTKISMVGTQFQNRLGIFSPALIQFQMKI